jgi:hypothetical protein
MVVMKFGVRTGDDRVGKREKSFNLRGCALSRMQYDATHRFRSQASGAALVRKTRVTYWTCTSRALGVPYHPMIQSTPSSMSHLARRSAARSSSVIAAQPSVS